MSRLQRDIQTPLRDCLVKWAAIALSLFASACFMAAAIGSQSYWWLGLITLLPLFNAIRILSPVRAGACGMFWGLSLFGVCALIGSTQISGDLTSAAYLGVIPGFYAFAGSALTRRVGFSPYLLGFGWIGVEFALQPLGLHYGLLAGTQSGDGLAIRLVGGFAGYVLVAFLVAYVNATLLTVLGQVRAAIAQPPPVVRAAAIQRRVYSTEIPSYLSHLLRISQPRAPPV